ncbi:hypothetical protein M972_112960 [Acetivibrio thermocellus AD2]|jgi:hypothetical protein|uniref:Uncharacterized protein n=1 Tax=Acetivibrio thermocellus AD2 TaxID=1138384 RepID=A0AB36TKR5_ACETH|nr:hypothetical protein Clo1313_2839 [Acetivibrio thermocellus DSM 1313]ALX09851.1 hypothetical protein AD2_02873 [Acetivibrio thermocellus AD2]ANV77625.1 hypothetical protein LQRI_2884 [Acetivibrio thermocellus DSM 2360]EIC03634.1 hypothetical protein YSBL_2592 [Acetivibrio thermocellus YS]SOD22327.1 hypothetical protein SAMN04515622_0635 [Acetivibrio thermocellus]
MLILQKTYIKCKIILIGLRGELYAHQKYYQKAYFLACKHLNHCFIVLYILGFRFTYNPEVISEWDAVSAMVEWVGVMTSAIVPLAAIYFQYKLDKGE